MKTDATARISCYTSARVVKQFASNAIATYWNLETRPHSGPKEWQPNARCCFFSIHAMLFLWWCSCGGVFVVVFLWSCLFCGVCVVVFLWWCFCSGVLVVVFVWWCFCVGVVVFLWWCFCAGVFVVVFLCWCFCGGVCVGVFVWLCSCGGVFVVVFSSWCGSVFVLVWWCSCGGVFVVVFLWWCTKSYSVLQRTTPVLRQYYKSFQNEHFVRGFRNFSQKKLPKSSFRARLPPNFTEQASKTSVSRDASNNFHRKSFQNHRFVRGFFQISQNKLPKRAFRAMLPTIFTEKASKMIVSCEASSKFHRTKLPKRAFRAMLPTIFTEKASKIIVSCEASSKFHRTSFQNERFARCFRQFSQKKLPKWSFRARLPPNFIGPSFQNERFARCFHQFSTKICVSPQFRAIDTPNPTRGFLLQNQNVRLATAACHPKFQNVRFATAPCTKMYESIDREPTRFAHTKMWRFTTVLDDRHHVFTERVDR